MKEKIQAAWRLLERFLRFLAFDMLKLKLTQKQWDAFIQFVRFGFVGLSNTLVSYTIYALSLLFFQKQGWLPRTDYLIAHLLAFALSVLLIAGMGVLAVVQNSRTLAVLGILAGFMAPIWLSTGSGNHVALFSYYAVLNAAILAIAWWRPWRALNLLGFAFTFGIGTAWGVLQYSADKFASTEPFLLLFFAFYLLIPILYARRQSAEKRDLIDGSLVFGTPLIAFSLQAGLLHDDRLLLALCSLALAALYAGLAWDYEFDSDARATYRGLATPSPSMKGSSGMLELGWQVKPGRSPMVIDLGVTGWAGKQRGITANLQANWTF